MHGRGGSRNEKRAWKEYRRKTEFGGVDKERKGESKVLQRLWPPGQEVFT